MFRVVLVALSGAILSAGVSARAQSTSLYTQTQLNDLKRRNSTQFYSSNQIRTNIYNRTIPRYSYSQANRDVFSQVLKSGPLGKPFQNAGGGGSVSPWLALSEPFSSSDHNYYTQVRPQLDQQRVNQQQAVRNEQLRRQLNSLAARGPYSVTGNENMAPTGHAAVYMNYGGYYTPVQPTKAR